MNFYTQFKLAEDYSFIFAEIIKTWYLARSP